MRYLRSSTAGAKYKEVQGASRVPTPEWLNELLMVQEFAFHTIDHEHLRISTMLFFFLRIILDDSIRSTGWEYDK